jgi:hypothetical protein
MRQRGMFMLALAAGLAALAGPATAGGTDDDLAIVKKAVASPSPGRAGARRPVASAAARTPAPVEGAVSAAAQATPAAPGATAALPSTPEARPLARSGREPRWFKVRVVEKATGRKKVTVNLPLSLVRALGDDTIDWGCRGDGDGERCHTVRLSEVLRTLEAGQELVEIDDEDATVKVWVE